MEFNSEHSSKVLFFLYGTSRNVGNAGAIFADTFLSEHEISNYCSSKDHKNKLLQYFNSSNNLLGISEIRNKLLQYIYCNNFGNYLLLSIPALIQRSHKRCTCTSHPLRCPRPDVFQRHGLRLQLPPVSQSCILSTPSKRSRPLSLQQCHCRRVVCWS